MTEVIPKATAYGGVLLQDGGILLREPSNHFDGYVWTFAKGRPEPGDTPEMTALREVLEETGYRAEVIDVLLGVFQGGTTTNAYFIMRPIGAQGQPDWETQSTRWASFDEAAQLIGLTTNTTGRTRDLAVLAAAKAWFERHGSAHFACEVEAMVARDASFVDAVSLAAQANYLGSPDTVRALLAGWFDMVSDCLAQAATAEQRHAMMYDLVRIMTEEPTFEELLAELKALDRNKE